MNHAKKTFNSLFIGLTVLLATLVLPVSDASAGNTTGNTILPEALSEEESQTLLEIYSLDEEVVVEQLTIKIYDSNDELIYSAKVCPMEYDCDERLNRMINDSDFITEVDDTRIYYLAQ